MLPFKCCGKQQADRSIPRKAKEWWQSLPCNNVSVCHSYLIDAFFILLSAFSDSLRHESTISPIVGGGGGSQNTYFLVQMNSLL